MTNYRIQRWAGSSGLSLASEVFGKADAPPVILVHGGGQTKRAWRGGAAVIASAGFRAISIDQRGHGESDWSPCAEYSPQDCASDLCEIMVQLDRPAILVGASRGGHLALLAAASYNGHAARALVMVDIAPRFDQSGAKQIREFMRSSAPGFDTVEEAADLLAGYMNRPKGKDPDRLRRIMRRGDDGRLYWHWDPRFADTLTETERFNEIYDEAARAIKCPALLVRGAQSEIIKDEHVTHFESLVPHAEIVSVPNAGHMVSGDENDAFNDAIVRFISRLPPL